MKESTPLYVRPATFGSRPTILAATLQRTQDGVATGAEVDVFIKSAWLRPELAGHETAVQLDLHGISGTPRPLGQICVDRATVKERFTAEDCLGIQEVSTTTLPFRDGRNTTAHTPIPSHPRPTGARKTTRKHPATSAPALARRDAPPLTLCA